MLDRSDIEKYEKKAICILGAIENSKVPIGGHKLDKAELIRVIKNELIKIDRRESEKSNNV